MASAVQCALNGGYGRDDHAGVPVTLEQVVADAVACRDAGAFSVHVHPRGDDGVPTLAAASHDAVVAAVRAAAPELELSCSTLEDIDLGGASDRVAAVRAWQTPPDSVSLNLVEEGSYALGAALLERGIAIEAGLFELADVALLLDAPWVSQVRRVLVEVVDETQDDGAVRLAREIDALVAPLGLPRLWHGAGGPTWAVVDAGIAAGVDVRVGLEDVLVARDGGPAAGNAGQVADTVARVG